MNRSVVSTALVFVVSLVVLGLTGCQQALDTNRNAAVATATPAKETFDPVAIQTEVMQVARDWMKAGQTYDPEIIKRVVADDAVLVYPDGTSATKADELRLVEAKAITTDSWDLLDPKVTVMSADSAFMSGRTVIKNGKYKDPSVSRPIDISGEYRFLDVYARRNGKWQVIASQATKVAAPAPAAAPAASTAPPSSPRPSPTATRTP
jgi:ketosteroid isomerase-like protein